MLVHNINQNIGTTIPTLIHHLTSDPRWPISNQWGSLKVSHCFGSDGSFGVCFWLSSSSKYFFNSFKNGISGFDWLSGDGGGGTIMGMFKSFFTPSCFDTETKIERNEMLIGWMNIITLIWCLNLFLSPLFGYYYCRLFYCIMTKLDRQKLVMTRTDQKKL